MNEYLLITGASSGAGKVIAQKLSSEYNLILSGRDEDALKETAMNCVNETLIWTHDLSDLDTVEEVLSKFIKEKNIKIKKFVHCAGDMKMIPCKMLTGNEFVKTFSINVFSAALIIKTLTSRKSNNKALDSALVISSNISNRGAKAFSIYGSSKAALDALVRNLAMELAPNVRINSILPGGMRTKMTESIFADEKVRKRIAEKYPLGEGEPNDLVEMIKLLLSDKASWITGQQIVIDGGMNIDITG